MSGTNNLQETVFRISETLGEDDDQPIVTIERIVNRFGVDFALEVLDEALELESRGGLMVQDGTRRRSLGGVFFYLIRGRIPLKDTIKIFSELPFDRNQKAKVVRNLKYQKGFGKVRITLIGRPGKVVEKRHFVITMIEDKSLPTLPRGLPRVPEVPTSYMVYITHKQWRRVRDSIQHPDDVLIVEGFARYDPELEGMAVYAMNTMTRLLQHKRRQEQRERDIARQSMKAMPSG